MWHPPPRLAGAGGRCRSSRNAEAATATHRPCQLSARPVIRGAVKSQRCAGRADGVPERTQRPSLSGCEGRRQMPLKQVERSYLWLHRRPRSLASCSNLLCPMPRPDGPSRSGAGSQSTLTACDLQPDGPPPVEDAADASRAAGRPRCSTPAGLLRSAAGASRKRLHHSATIGGALFRPPRSAQQCRWSPPAVKGHPGRAGQPKPATSRPERSTATRQVPSGTPISPASRSMKTSRMSRMENKHDSA